VPFIIISATTMGRFRTSAPRLLMAASHLLHLATTAHGLRVALLSGSTRTSSPPTVLHPRVNAYIRNALEQRGHAVSHVDPRDFALLERPHFAYPRGTAPSRMSEIHSILEDADCYVCVTPEYNHSPSPALLNVLNHFGSSTFSFKPSAIGMRGCLYRERHVLR
jgi:NAD(P)H-dependent FMN reductase